MTLKAREIPMVIGRPSGMETTISTTTTLMRVVRFLVATLPEEEITPLVTY
jgi:hypothetical protein